jgi:uncharacterized membrane protein HdeD (DUF308 family)
LSSELVSKAWAGQLLRRLYLLRVGFSALWVTLILVLNASPSHHTSATLVVRLVLSLYPIADAGASLIETRATNTLTYRRLLHANAAAGCLAAIAILFNDGIASDIRAFGVWAIASGAAQLLVAALRQKSLKGQWLMIISGAGSVFAGATFAGLLGSSTPGLAGLAQYSVGGAIWYVLTAGFLVAVSHTPRGKFVASTAPG